MPTTSTKRVKTIGKTRNLSNTYRRKRYTAAKNRRNNILARKQVGILGLNPKVNFIYGETLNINPTIFDVYEFFANGLYDPNVSGGGHQPSGFDAIATLYKHYIILKVKFTVRAINNSTTIPAYVGGCFSRLGLDGLLDGSNPVVNFEEQSSAKTYMLGIKGSGAEVKTFTQVIIPHKFMGMPKAFADNRFWGDNTAGPDEKVFWNLFTASVDQSSNPSVTYNVRVEFFTVWREPLKRDIN